MRKNFCGIKKFVLSSICEVRYGIDVKFLQIVGNKVVYNPLKFQIDSINIAKMWKNFLGTDCGNIQSFSFQFVSVGLFCFGSIETQKLAVPVKHQNNRNKRFVSDSAKTSFGSIFSCFKSKLVSLDTLILLFKEASPMYYLYFLSLSKFFFISIGI